MPPARSRVRSATRQTTQSFEDGASCLSSSLLVEPGVLKAPAIVIAVDHHRVPLELGLPAGRRARIEDDRTCGVFGQSAFDLPHQLLALVAFGLHRLLVDQPVDLGIAITGVIALGTADEI